MTIYFHYFVHEIKILILFVLNSYSSKNSIFDLLLRLQWEEDYYKTHVPLSNTLSEQYYLIMAILDAVQIGPQPLSSNASAVHESSRHIQLPKIQISSFDGGILLWIPFRDTFKS